MEGIVSEHVSVAVGVGNDDDTTLRLDTLHAQWPGHFLLVIVGAVIKIGTYMS